MRIIYLVQDALGFQIADFGVMLPKSSPTGVSFHGFAIPEKVVKDTGQKINQVVPVLVLLVLLVLLVGVLCVLCADAGAISSGG